MSIVRDVAPLRVSKGHTRTPNSYHKGDLLPAGGRCKGRQQAKAASARNKGGAFHRSGFLRRKRGESVLVNPH